MPALEALYDAIRGATRVPIGWDDMAQAVVASVRDHLPPKDQVLESVPLEARTGHERSQVLHVEPDGTFSVVALISRPGQATSIHDHTTWCVVAVVAGAEHEERFQLNDTGHLLELTGEHTDRAGTVSGFAPPGDIHRVTNRGETVGISLHIYGTDLNRISSSVRRTYEQPVG